MSKNMPDPLELLDDVINNYEPSSKSILNRYRSVLIVLKIKNTNLLQMQKYLLSKNVEISYNALWKYLKSYPIREDEIKYYKEKLKT